MLIKYSAEKLKDFLYRKIRAMDNSYKDSETMNELNKYCKMISFFEIAEDDTVLLSFEEANDLGLI